MIGDPVSRSKLEGGILRQIRQVCRSADRVIVCSNRGTRSSDLRPSAVRQQGRLTGLPSGGLVTVLASALGDKHARWVFSADQNEASANSQSRVFDHRSRIEPILETTALKIESGLYQRYYENVSNSFLWPVLHGLSPFRSLSVEDWEAYQEVNRLFAETCSNLERRKQEPIIVFDYQLSLAPRMIRQIDPQASIGYCHFTPWCERSVISSGRARDLVLGILGASSVTFLARAWAFEFLSTCQQVGLQVDMARSTVDSPEGYSTAVSYEPICIDIQTTREAATEQAVRRYADELRELIGGRQLIVSAERLDPTKNTLRTLEAIHDLIKSDYPHEFVLFLQLFGSRQELPGYSSYSKAVRASVAAIREKLGARCVILREIEDRSLGLAALSIADVIIINSIRDGMNLIAQDAVVVGKQDSQIILSRLTGSAEILGDYVILLDPLDSNALVGAIKEALKAAHSGAKRHQRKALSIMKGHPPQKWLKNRMNQI